MHVHACMRACVCISCVLVKVSSSPPDMDASRTYIHNIGARTTFMDRQQFSQQKTVGCSIRGPLHPLLEILGKETVSKQGSIQKG
jgi:hypothetical protein